MKDCCKSCINHPCQVERARALLESEGYNAGQEEDNGARAGTWIMLVWLAMLAAMLAGLFGLTSCAHADDWNEHTIWSEQQKLQVIKEEVHSRMTYTSYKGWLRPDDLPADKGNCVDFARAYMKAAHKTGFKAEMMTCQVPAFSSFNGERYVSGYTPHAFAKVGDYALDVRNTKVVLMEEVGCLDVKEQ